MSIIYFTASTFLFLLATTTVFVVGQSTGNCLSLGASQVCSAFSQFYVGLPGLEKDYPFLLNTTTIEEFDKRLIAHVNSTSSYLFPMGCLSSNFNPTIPYPRYSLTKLCAALIQNPSYSLPCNFDNQLQPPPLCQKTCFEWVDSVTRITDNPRVCSPSAQRNMTLESYNTQCMTWEGFNGNVSENCISGIANEPYTCGFGPDDKRMACRYCERNGDDMCCQNVSGCNSSLSAGAIVGIVIGCIIAVVLAILALVCICRRKKPLSNPFLFMSSSASSSATTQGRNKEYNSNSIPEESIKVPPTPSPLTTIATQGGNKVQRIESDASTTVIPSATQTPSNEEFYVVVHPYPPQMADELELNYGDIICLALNFDDGWALGFNVTTGLKGAFPIVCISPAPEDSLDQLLSEDIQQQQQQGRPLSYASVASSQQLHSTMEHIRENVKRSLSLNSYNNNNNSMHPSFTTTTNNNHTTTNTNNTHDTNNKKLSISTTTNNQFDTSIPPKRSSLNNNYDYIEADSPSSPTFHTPFFDPPPPPPSVAPMHLKPESDYNKKPPSV